MEEILSNYSSIDIETMQKNMEKIRIKCMEVELLKKNLEKYFGFEITDYIILDIIENEDYNKLVDVATSQGRDVYIVPTYTSMMTMRPVIAKRLGGKDFWE